MRLRRSPSVLPCRPPLSSDVPGGGAGVRRLAGALVLLVLVACAGSREPATAADTGRRATSGLVPGPTAAPAAERGDRAGEAEVVDEHAALRAELAVLREANAALRRDVVALWAEVGRRPATPPSPQDAPRVRPDPPTLPD